MCVCMCVCLCISQEVQHGDPLVLLAAHCLQELAVHTSQTASASGGSAPAQRALVLEAIILLEAGRTESAYNFQFTLLLMRMYLSAGCFTAALELFNKLDVKHIQLDSLSYLIFDDCIRFGAFDEARSLCSVRVWLRRPQWPLLAVAS